jgi:hypothetical protein
MNNKKIIEFIVLFGIMLTIIVMIRIHFKKLENFESQEQKKIIDEIDKQLYILNNASKVNPDSQSVPYMPHLDIINKYEGNSLKFLNTIKESVNNKTKIQNQDLEYIDNYIKSLSRYDNDNRLKEFANADFKSIKSHNNGLSINMNKVGYNKYQLLVNDGCIEVSPENDYNIKKCNVNNKGQIFKLEHIFNETEYRNSLDKAFPQLSKLDKVHYPMTMVKSIINDNCLKNYHNNITIEPCREYEGQRWASTKTNNTC